MDDAIGSTAVAETHFEDRRANLLPTLYYCGLFFATYYAVLVGPRFGFGSEVFAIDNLGGVCIVAGFVAGHWLSKRYKWEWLLLLPSFGSLAASTLFLAHQRFYFAVDHLWLSAQIIGIVFATFLGTPRWNVALFALNVLVPVLVAGWYEHLDPAEIAGKQAIVYFASLVSSFLAHSNLEKKRELLEAKNEAIRAEQAKTAFLANMSHEMRTPLNGVLGMLTMLRETDVDSAQREMLDTAHVCGDGLLTIINDVLDLSKIEAGRLQLELVNFNLRTCLETSFYLVDQMASRKSLETRLDYPEAAREWFVGDVTRIRQVIVNFLSNAVKFTSEGSVTITVSTVEDGPTQSRITVEVTDTGIGIDPGSLDRLFVEFSQADSSTTRRFGGTGLGLSICAKLAVLMGGEVSVRTTPGEGSTFGLALTLAHGQPEGLEPESTLATPQLGARFPHRILVAEDNRVNQRVITMMLRKLGYECTLAANGREVLDAMKLSPTHFTLVFMDMQMPEMDGVEATKRIVSVYGEARPPIVAMTANAFEEDKRRCLEAGMVGFVGKPIGVEALAHILVEHAQEPKTTQQAK
ncbi:MAG: ATP-binding protein [Myxococcales bacterium]|nr:ATP-binding protein [Myxococcales bacterium]MDD9969693.1 ATP-binding protein [Myxococcales bacterium]